MQFASRDPSSPAFWDERFEQQFKPWDKGGVPLRLRQFMQDTVNGATLASLPLPTTLIPGCGSAWELAALCAAGWDATAIDFSPVAVAAAREQVGAKWQDRVVQADFFHYAPPAPVQCIYERAFLCAMPRALWPQVAQRWAQLLAPGGMLAGYFFIDNNAKGPPFGIPRAELDALLAPYFTCVGDEPVTDSLPVFDGKERWMSWFRIER